MNESSAEQGSQGMGILAVALFAAVLLIAAVGFATLVPDFGPPPQFLLGSTFGVSLGLASVTAIWMGWGTRTFSLRILSCIPCIALAMVFMWIPLRGSTADGIFILLPIGYFVLASVPLGILRVKGFRLQPPTSNGGKSVEDRYQFSIRKLIMFTTFAAFAFFAIKAFAGVIQLPARWQEVVQVMSAMIACSAVASWLCIILAFGKPRVWIVILIAFAFPLIGKVESLAIESVVSSAGLQSLFVALQIAQAVTIACALVVLKAFGYVVAISGNTRSEGSVT
ncbi:MAG: hypothetical protein AB8B91_14240 [Rubripirellula sp.]